MPILYSSVIFVDLESAAPTPSTASTLPYKTRPPRDFPLLPALKPWSRYRPSSPLPVPAPLFPLLGSGPPRDTMCSSGCRVLHLWLSVTRWCHPFSSAFCPTSIVIAWVPGFSRPYPIPQYSRSRGLVLLSDTWSRSCRVLLPDGANGCLKSSFLLAEILLLAEWQGLLQDERNP